MKLELVTVNDDTQWDDTVALIGGPCGHSAAFAKYQLAAQPNAVARHFQWRDDAGAVKGIAIGFETHSPHRVLSSFTRRLEFITTPAVAAGSEHELLPFMRAIDDQARRAGIVEVEIGSAASTTGAAELEQLGYTATKRLEFELDLERTEDELWQGMEYKRRKNIKKAMRQGVAIEQLEGVEAIHTLRQLQGHSSQRIVARGGRDITYKGQLTSDPVAVLLESGLSRIFGARVDGQIVSAGMFTKFNRYVYHMLSGHSAAALETQAPTYLLWEMFRRFREEGARCFNFGGCSAVAALEGHHEHGVYTYKMGFGGRCIECTSGRKVLRRRAYSVVQRMKKVLGRS